VALEKYPKNTFIGRIEWGFDFLGYHLNPKGLTVCQGDTEAVRFVCNPAL
jgi:hypothetical protein